MARKWRKSWLVESVFIFFLLHMVPVDKAHRELSSERFIRVSHNRNRLISFKVCRKKPHDPSLGLKSHYFPSVAFIFYFLLLKKYHMIVLGEIRRLRGFIRVSCTRNGQKNGFLVFVTLFGLGLAPGIFPLAHFWKSSRFFFSFWKHILKEQVESCRLSTFLGSRRSGKVPAHPWKVLVVW